MADNTIPIEVNPPAPAPAAKLTRIVNGVPTTPSIIAIPPQIATTIVWIALGFGVCWWLMSKQQASSRRREKD